MTLNDKLIAWLKDNQVFNGSVLCKEVGISSSTFSEWMNGDRKVMDKHIMPLVHFLAPYGLKIDDWTFAFDEAEKVFILTRPALDAETKISEPSLGKMLYHIPFLRVICGDVGGLKGVFEG